jgi:hypothetical protein
MTRLVAVVGATLVFWFATASLDAMGQNQEPRPIIGPWSKAKTTPQELAKLVDARLSGLHQVLGAYQVWLTLSGTGRSTGDLLIKDSNTFRIEYADMHYRKKDSDAPITKAILVSDGHAAKVIPGKGKGQMAPIAKLRLYTANRVDDWVMGYPRYIAASIHGEHALADLVKLATKPNSQYRLLAQERDVIAAGRTYPQARILIERTSSAAKLQGPLSIELVFSTKDYLPVSVTTSEAPLAKADVATKGAFGWQSSRTAFPSDKFAVKKK